MKIAIVLLVLTVVAVLTAAAPRGGQVMEEPFCGRSNLHFISSTRTKN